MNKKIKHVVGAMGIGTVALIAAGLPYQKINVTEYVLHSSKIQDTVRFCVLADLHCRNFGKKQDRIVKAIDKIQPDYILIPGDLFDVDRDYEIAFTLIRALNKYPMYFTSGNHDMYLREDIDDLRRRLEDLGVCVLEDCGTELMKGNTQIEIYGMSDHGRKPLIQGKDLKYMFHTNAYRILISHRPDYTEFYKEAPCDMVVSGHVHGGQWRIPVINKGIYGPQQGLFPKYYQGIHDLNGTKLVISRGLASGDPHIPRLFNDPEIVCITLKHRS